MCASGVMDMDSYELGVNRVEARLLVRVVDGMHARNAGGDLLADCLERRRGVARRLNSSQPPGLVTGRTCWLITYLGSISAISPLALAEGRTC